MPILSGLGYIFMGCGALIAVIGFYIAIAQGRIGNVVLMWSVPVFLVGAGFALLAHGIAILRLLRSAYG